MKQIKDKFNNALSIEDKLFITEFLPDIKSHIKINTDFCLICRNKECTKFCPAKVFSWSDFTAGNELIVAYENCLECGVCKTLCPFEAIKYNHPEPGYGVL